MLKQTKRTGIFAFDPQYKAETAQYTPLDGILALGVFVLMMLAYAGMGVISARTGVYLGVPVNLFFLALCLVLPLLRHQGLQSVGITQKKFLRSLCLGLACGALLLCMNVVPGLLNGQVLNEAKVLVTRFFYYLFVIALPEEIVFRGYIQSRLMGLVRREWLSILLTSILFVLMHIPFQMCAANLSLAEYLIRNAITFPFLMLWHYVFTYLFRKYDSLTAPTMAHALMDFGNILLK